MQSTFQLCDTHCHLDDMRYAEDFDAMIKRAEDSGITRFIIPGADIADLKRAQDLAHQYPNVYFAAGVHPSDCESCDNGLIAPLFKGK